VKVVEHPPSARSDRAAARTPSTIIRVPVVSLNRAAVAAACVGHGGGSTIASTPQEAA
jgi:hypothetical protein